MTKIVSRHPHGTWAVQHKEGQFLCDPGFWTTDEKQALRFKTHEDAQYIADGLFDRKAMIAGKPCWGEVKGDTVSLLKPVLLYCCEAMRHHSTLSCTVHTFAQDCPDVLVTWSNQHGPGLPVRDGGSSFVTIQFCPWCGSNVGNRK